MTNHSTAGSWHASDDVVRLLHNETTTAAAASAAAESSTATATVTVASAAAASAHRSSRATVAAIIAGFAGGADDDNGDAPTTGWPPPAGYSDADPLEFNQTADDADDGAAEQVKLNLDTGSNFMLLLEDFGEYFYNGNNGTDALAAVTASTAAASDATGMQPNDTLLDYVVNCTLQQLENGTIACGPPEETEYSYWALILLLFPILTLFGNVLVILSVYRERALQTVTNYFIVSLALADLLVAVVVMPFAVYVLVNNGQWSLPEFVCDYYIAMDVICSTSSIFNLVAISIDRYIAVTQPIKYARHRNSKRVSITILLVWAISVAIGSPIVLGLNSTPTRAKDLCMFYNSDFIIFSSLSSFYIPCIIMVFLYWNIFKALRQRAAKQRAARKPHLTELATGGNVIENVAQTRKLAETTLDGSGSGSKSGSRIMADEVPTNTASGSNEDDDDNAAASPDIDDCHVIVNDKSTEFMLATVVEEAGNVVAQITSPSTAIHLHQQQLHHGSIVADPNGNHDSGYAPSAVEETQAGTGTPTTGSSPRHGKSDITATPMSTTSTTAKTTITMSVSTEVKVTASSTGAPAKSGGGGGSGSHASRTKRNGVSANSAASSPKKEPLSVAMKPLSLVRYGVQEALALARHDSTISTQSRGSTKEKKNAQASRTSPNALDPAMEDDEEKRFTIYKVHKASKKKREKSSAKRERKATKTLAIVLGVFLFCWVPFFTCNMLDALCTKLEKPDCNPGINTFIFTTWLGYMNSFVNPVIYTIFNPEFRKAFKKIMHIK